MGEYGEAARKPGARGPRENAVEPEALRRGREPQTAKRRIFWGSQAGLAQRQSSSFVNCGSSVRSRQPAPFFCPPHLFSWGAREPLSCRSFPVLRQRRIGIMRSGNRKTYKRRLFRPGSPAVSCTSALAAWHCGPRQAMAARYVPRTAVRVRRPDFAAKKKYSGFAIYCRRPLDFAALRVYIW